MYLGSSQRGLQEIWTPSAERRSSRRGALWSIRWIGELFEVKETPSDSDEHQRQQDLVLEISSTALDDEDLGGNGRVDLKNPKEEVVCRICLVEVGEDEHTLKMECGCKGGPALAHQDCVLQWLGIKGNNTCDVCKQEVRNLPLILQIYQALVPGVAQDRFHRFGEHVYSLAIGYALAYFCLLELLMVRESGFLKAMPASLVFSISIGLMASITSSTLAAQFVLVVPCAFFIIKTINCYAVIAVCIPAFVGWMISACCGDIIDAVARRRTRKLKQQPHASVTVQIGTDSEP